MSLWAAGLVAVAGAGMMPLAAAQDVPLRALVERFENARTQFDAAALGSTLAPDYEEISPVGDVDSRARVLGYYAPEARRPAPPMTSSDIVVHAQGSMALVTARRSIALPNGTTRSLRARYVARLERGAWQLVSAQYTPIPPAKAP
ncbi:nuclear transport factor 2 family protein [Sphingomonas zeae]|jgi:ketosteroid isomerase-like protein